MKKYGKVIVIGTIGTLVFFALMGIIGDYEYCEQVVLHMSQEQYDSVKSHLEGITGSEPSERDIAHWWVDHNKDIP